VFATSPQAAGEIVRRLAGGQAVALRQAEVMDIDEDAYRAGRISARLFGYMSVPSVERALQMPKARSIPEASASASVARAVAAMMDDASTLWIIGPGTTTRAVMAELGLEGSLLGVDVVRGGSVLARDVDEATLLRMIQETLVGRVARHAHADALRDSAQPAAVATDPRSSGAIAAGGGSVATATAKIVVTPIGGQGYIFGRGNHQLSARVLEAVGRDNILVIATPAKLFGLHGAPLLVDTDDERVNRSLRGYMRVITGAGQEIVYPVAT
jgi:predicted polyphosphate/ATP-dependent NAD kinase